MIILEIENHVIKGIRVESDTYEPKQNEEQANVVDGALILPNNLIGIDWMISPFTREYQLKMSSDDPFDDSLTPKDMPECQAIKKIVIPSSLQYMKSGFFQNFPYVEKIQFPGHSSLVDIGPRTFADCRKLKEIVIPPNANGDEVIIGVDAFIGCKSIKKIDTPKKSCLIIHEYEPFLGCDNLHELNIRGRGHKKKTAFGLEESGKYKYEYKWNIEEELKKYEENDKNRGKDGAGKKVKDETDKIIDIIEGERFLLYRNEKDNNPNDYSNPNKPLEEFLRFCKREKKFNEHYITI